MVWLRDGSRLLSKKLEVGNDKLTIAPALIGGRQVTIALKDIARIEIASKKGQLIDVVDLPYKVIAGGHVFGLKVSPRLSGTQLRLHAPVTLSIALPKGTVRFAAVVSLDEKADRRWANCVVHIRSGKQALAKHHLQASAPSAQINLPLASIGVGASAASFEIEIDPAINGPVMDRVLLRDAIVFVKYQ